MNSELARQLGARHLLVGVNSSGPRESGGRVRISAGATLASTAAGQLLLWMVTSLAARQFGVVREIEFDLPDIAAIPDAVCVFQEAPGPLRLVLESLVPRIAKDAIGVRTPERSFPPDFEISIGPVDDVQRAWPMVAAYADGWRSFVGPPEFVPLGAPASKLPIGPYFSACMATGEMFLHLTGFQGRGKLEPTFISLFDFKSAATWGAMEAGSDVLMLPPVLHVVGAGAVAQALACTLGMCGGLHSTVYVIDRDCIDREGTNLNRCILSAHAHLGYSKTKLTTAFMRGKGLDAHDVPYMWEEYLAARAGGQFDGLGTAIERIRFPFVVSCVDKNPARHAIQKTWPKRLVGGSTNDLSLAVAEYSMPSKYECLMCSNPLPYDESVEAIAERIGSMPKHERKAFAECNDANFTLVEEYLARPTCGSLGEMELRKFKQRPSPDASVGFVSVAAGVVLASYILRNPEEFAPHFIDGNTLRYTFSRPAKFYGSSHLRRAKCECSSVGKARFASLWD